MKTNLTALVFRAGRITLIGSICLVLLGLFAVVLSLLYLPSSALKIVGLSIGLAIAAIGGFSGRASALDLPPPFSQDPLGWRRASRKLTARTDAPWKMNK